MRRLLLLLVIALLAGAGLLGWWVTQPLPLRSDTVEMSVPAGASLRTAANQAVKAGVELPADVLYGYFRWQAGQQTIKPGDYAVTRGMRAQDLLDKLIRGDRILLPVTFVEGWTFKQVRQALAQAEQLKHDSAALSGAEVMTALGRPGVAPEGRFFPDTYLYAKNASDLAVLREALQLMDKRLAAAWDARTPGLPLKTPDDALILASLVEKETGQAADRAEIAGVFINRLRLGMRLQTDPSVIYGLGDAFDGNLKRSHLAAQPASGGGGGYNISSQTAGRNRAIKSLEAALKAGFNRHSRLVRPNREYAEMAIFIPTKIITDYRIFFAYFNQLRAVAIYHRWLTWQQSRQYFAFGPGYILQAAQGFEVHGFGIGNNRTGRPGYTCQKFNFAALPHGHFHHCSFIIFIYLHNAQWQANFIIKISRTLEGSIPPLET